MVLFMNKKRMIMIVVSMLMIFCVGCDTKNVVVETQANKIKIEEAVDESIPGIESNAFQDDDYDDDESNQENDEEKTNQSQNETKAPALNNNSGGNTGNTADRNTEKDTENATDNDTENNTEDVTNETKEETPESDKESTPEREPDVTTSYEMYVAMSPEEQEAFFATFDGMEAFVAWYNMAKSEYEASNPNVEIGDGAVNLGDTTKEK